MTKKVSKKSKRRLMTFGLLSIFAIGYFCFTLFGYIYNYIKLTNEEKVLQEQLSSLQQEKYELKIEIQKLNDPNYAIRYAKEKFLYSSDGEYIIKINPIEAEIKVEDKKNNVTPIVFGSIILFLGILLFARFKGKQTKKI